MPELPEVETAARDLDAAVRGARIAAVIHLDWPRMIEGVQAEAFVAALPGCRIERVWRRAKWLLVDLGPSRTLALHLRMSGSLYVPDPGEALDGHVRLVLALDDGRSIRFRDVRKFGRARLLDAEGLAALDATFGPEPLEPGFTATWLRRALARRSTRLKPLLLDQAFIAGLGNIYVDEALWLSGLHPERAASSVSSAEATALHAAIVAVLTSSIRRRGSTLRDYRTGTGELGGNQAHFQAYGRTGQPCPRCGTPITRLVVGQRGTHLCPTCQPLEKRRSGRALRNRPHPAVGP